MKLLKHTPIKAEVVDGEYTESEEMVSDDLIELKSKAYKLCKLMGVEPSAWTSRYPIMGNEPINSNTEWVMRLEDGTAFSIEK